MNPGTFSLTQVQTLPRLLVKSRSSKQATSRSQAQTGRLDLTQDKSLSTEKETLYQSRTYGSLPMADRFQETTRQIETEKLLNRMVKIERSSHVKDQLKRLELEVLQAKKYYNTLYTTRERKEAQLTRMAETHGILLTTDEAVLSSDRILSLQDKLARALAQLERENAMTETLEHMLAERKKAIAMRAQPTVPMQRKLVAAETIKAGTLMSLTQTDLEIRANHQRLKDLRHEFLNHHSAHQDLLTSVLEKYSHRREFVELAEAHKGQQELRSQLKESEMELAGLRKSLREVEAAERQQRASISKRAELDKMEEAINQLTTAAKTDTPSGILSYWEFLTESEDYLKSTASSLEERIATAHQLLEDSKREFEAVVGALADVNSQPATISCLEGKHREVEQTLETRKAKARVRAAVSHLVEKVGADKVMEEDSALSMLEVLEKGVVAIMQDREDVDLRDCDTQRTKLTLPKDGNSSPWTVEINMKAVLLVSLVALASASGFLELEALGGNVGSNCNTALTQFGVSSFVLTPWPPARNENVSMNMTGAFTTSESINALVVNVNYQKVPFYQLVLPRTGSFQKGAAYKDGYTAFFPTIAPSGNYAVMLQLRSSTNAYLNCWEVTFTL